MDPTTFTSQDAGGPARRRRSATPVGIVDNVFITYLVGCAIGRGLGLLWSHGPAHEEGLRRLLHGAADLAHPRT